MPLKLLFVFSRIIFLASIVLLQLILAYKTDITEFAYVSFGFSLLSIAMVAFTFGFNQFLMYTYSRESILSLDDLFSRIFKIFTLNGLLVSVSLIIFLQFYTDSYMYYGILFAIISLLLSVRDYFNVPYIIHKQYRDVSISNIIISLPFYAVTLYLLFSPAPYDIKNVLLILILLLTVVILTYDYKKHAKVLFKRWGQFNILNDYLKTFSFGLSVFLFTIYYQLSNILLPLLEKEAVVATFGVVFIYLGILYTFLNIVFNQLILPNMYASYKQDPSQHAVYVQKYKQIFFYGGLALSSFSLILFYLSENSNIFDFITDKYPDLFYGIAFVSLGILSRYIATVHSGNLNVLGLISLKVKVQLIVTGMSFLLTYYLITSYSFIGACGAYSLTETLLLFGYFLVGARYVKKA